MGRATVQDGRSSALEFPMDIMTGVGLVSGMLVVTVMVLMGGDLHMFVSEHAVIIIFGGSIAATMIRFPLSATTRRSAKLLDEETNRTLIIDGILMIRDSKSPTLVREMLLAYLPEKHRHEEGEPVPA